MTTEGPPPRKLLVIAYYFPPMGLSGVQRTLKFVKYLPQFGWQPIILTVTPTGYYAEDITLLKELEEKEIEIVRVGSFDPNHFFRKKGLVKMPSERWAKFLGYMSDLFFIPDNKIGWRRKAFKAACDLCAKNKFDVIFATAPPFTDFLIGADLHQKFNIPLVLDYRDPWLEYPIKHYPTPYHRWKNYVLEKSVLERTAKVITTNRRVKELILKQYDFLNYEDVQIIPQGFDPEDFPSQPPPPVQPSEKFVLTHTGVFNGDRTPKYFLHALKKAISENPGLKGNIEARMVGNFQDGYRKLVQSMGLENEVTITGYLTHHESLRELAKADCLWFMLMNDRQSPGKVYEYIAARKPILACVPEGFVRQTVLETGAGTVVKPTNVDEISQAILELYEGHLQGRLLLPKEDIVQRYDRISLTQDLSKILGFLTESAP